LSGDETLGYAAVQEQIHTLMQDAITTSSNDPCVACRRRALTLFGARRGYRYYRCGGCGTLQLVPMPDPEALRRDYAEGYARADHWQQGPGLRNAAVRGQSQALVDALTRNGIRSNLLEVGSGWGALLDLMREHGIDCEGVEPSCEMRAHCVTQGHTVHAGTLETLDAPLRYDAVVFSSVFEHLVEHERCLEASCALLAPNGFLISLQPTALFPTFAATVIRFGMRRLPLPQLHHVLCPPWHTVIFSIDGMSALLGRHGFRLHAVHIAPQQRDAGLTGIAQRVLERVNRVGWRVAGVRWPLAVGHVFEFQKVDDTTPTQEGSEI